MKKILLLLLTVTLILSCSSDDNTEGRRGGLKLKSERTITDYIDEHGFRVNYDYRDEYFYGANGFVEKIRNYSFLNEESYEYFYYEGDKVVKRLFKYLDEDNSEVEEAYSYKDGLIVESLSEYKWGINNKKYYYDSSKNIIKEEHYYTYFDTGDTYESMIEYEYRDGNVQTEKSSYEYSYEYDNKHIPTKNSFPDAFKKFRYKRKNNITKFTAENEEVIREYKYEYNSKGYPIKATYDDGNVTILYEYY